MPHVPKNKGNSSVSGSGINEWVSSRPYSPGDVVYYINSIYTCQTLHVSSLSFFDDQLYWVSLSSYYVHTQSSSDTTWTIDHFLGRKPNVSILNSSNTEMEGKIEHTTNNRLYVYFNTPVSGSVICT